ncbi:hypothetical protein PPL_04461 [Heterostelium album PN500]|uniref:Thioredoxin domain-containing protein n=1 Tax=Heterostelium pallidum (strain ATCC 26659 / Pp 5 / PN500) TaxID=670386 RepID=D3B7M3_HETP5|nr:hypothetical protein PPL_04461 [Heterostelium album PN500]EFA82766.1 hypothetical protein PPL_04461 [Heterostelium album PN500]|eukprot:XP_020434883.1 hypothetical protein PPL_04461 [Heterostelium album PN500]
MNKLAKLVNRPTLHSINSIITNTGRTHTQHSLLNRSSSLYYRSIATPSSSYTLSSHSLFKRSYSSSVTEPQQQNESNKQSNESNKNNSNENNNNNNVDKETKKNEHHSQKRQITFASLMVALFFGGAGWLYYDHLMVQKREKIKQIETYGSSSIGGPFSLVDENGKPISDLDFRGKYILLYFGFTYCPDACPAELDKMTVVLNNLEKYKLLDSIVPVFITIDPWRDTVEQINTYIKEFHPKFRGLTGTPEQITKLAKSYRVFISKAGKGDSYLVDHTIIEYLIGPDGKFIEFYGSNLTADQVTMKVVERMANKGLGGANTGEITKEKSMVDKILNIFSSSSNK